MKNITEEKIDLGWCAGWKGYNEDMKEYQEDLRREFESYDASKEEQEKYEEEVYQHYLLFR